VGKIPVIRIHPGQPPAVSFAHDHEGLNHMSKAMLVPVPADL
jgi:hypothetical protein